MPIEPVDGKLGLWRSGKANAPGVHALIIGISDYPYLLGGSAPKEARTRDNGGLGQLEVSAYSAALFFDWVIQAGDIGGAPLASCRLHLAPRPDEADRVASLKNGGNYADASYTTLRAALDEWTAEMSVAGRTGQEPNVALFFHSGHGVEIAASPAILASDVLDQFAADGGVGKAIAIEPMTLAVKTYNIDRGLFFVDACRDAPLAARMMNLIGDQSLNPNRFPTRRPDALLRLHSTASGRKSYQIKDGEGTLFTEAVLNGLEGRSSNHQPYDTSSIPWPLRFAALEGHVKRLVTTLLAEYSPLAIQSVEPFGNPYNGEMVVAQMAAKPPAAAADGDRAEVSADDAPAKAKSVPERVDLCASKVFKNVKSIRMGTIDALRDEFTAPHQNDLNNPAIMDGVLQHDILRYWINGIDLRDARTGRYAPPDALHIYNAHIRQIGDQVSAWIDLAIKPGMGDALWIGAHLLANSSSHAVVIPRDNLGYIPVRLDLLFIFSKGHWRLSRMSARLADPAPLAGTRIFGDGLSDVWTTLFNAQRTEAFADLSSAVRVLKDREGNEVIPFREKTSAVAAAFAANLLLRAGELNSLREWPKFIADHFPLLPDGPILWAETILQRREAEGATIVDRGPPDALRYFLLTANRGAPLLSNTLQFAVKQASLWRPWLTMKKLKAEDHRDLARALRHIDRAAHYANSGQGFVRFASNMSVITPRDVLGAAPNSVPPSRPSEDDVQQSSE